MNYFESIVPALELCKQVPAGVFDHSVLVWSECDNSVYVRERMTGDMHARHVSPAPVLDEILEYLPDCVELRMKGSNHCLKHKGVSGLYHDKNLAGAALKLWMKLNQEGQIK